MLISLTAHYLPQTFFFSKSQFAPSPHLLRCPFAPSVLLSFIRCPYAPVPICPKCPFISNFLHSPNIHFPRCPRAKVPIIPPNNYLSQVGYPIVPRPKCLGPICPGPKCMGPNYPQPCILVPICPGFKCTGPNCPRPNFLVPIRPGVRLSRRPFVWGPNVRKPPSTPYTRTSQTFSLATPINLLKLFATLHG